MGEGKNKREIKQEEKIKKQSMRDRKKRKR